jgi:membrane-associated protease RseP (regulator of RpoE activity)
MPRGGPWWTVCRVAGIPVCVGPGVLLGGAALVLATSLPTGLVTWAVLLGSALVHEAGHAFVGRRQGLAVRGIYFGWIPFVWVGAGPPAAVARTALAGPLASLGGAALLALLPAARDHLLTGAAHLWRDDPLTFALALHLLMAGINLVPVRPLDGGRVLEAVLSVRGTPAAAAQVLRLLGVVVAVGIAVAALVWRGDHTLPLGLLAAVIAYAALAPAADVAPLSD